MPDDTNDGQPSLQELAELVGAEERRRGTVLMRPMPDDWIPEKLVVDGHHGPDKLGFLLEDILDDPKLIMMRLDQLRYSLWVAAETRRVAAELRS